MSLHKVIHGDGTINQPSQFEVEQQASNKGVLFLVTFHRDEQLRAGYGR